MNRPTAQDVRSRLNYDPETGVFTWRTSKVPARVGTVAGAVSNGRRAILVAGRLYGAHVLAWVIVTGDWPERGIDHRDLDGLNNRWTNLRLATKSQNAQNTPRRVDNTSGFKGVAWDARRGKWRADIRVPGGKRMHLGMHDDPAVGHAAYVAAAKELFGEFGRAS